MMLCACDGAATAADDRDAGWCKKKKTNVVCKKYPKTGFVNPMRFYITR